MLCPLCHSQKSQDIFTANNFHGRHQISSQKIPFKKCLNCNCVFPDLKIDKNFYQKYYPKNYQRPSPILEKIWCQFNIISKKRYLPNSGTLLDVGCGSGDFIKSLSANIKSFGIDINPPKAKNIIKADFLKHNFSEKFDVITFWHSLEHFSNPIEAINKSISLLKKHGQILIAIPNTNSFAFKVSQENWFHLDPPRHLFLPNDQNIYHLFPKKSCLKIKALPFEFPLDLFWSLKKKPILKIFYPILKLFDQETILISFEI